MAGKTTKPQILLITGQTGTGKTSLALQIAKTHNGELISVDSRQVYQGLDIGTGKIDHASDLVQTDNTYRLKGIPIHGINLISPNQTLSAGEFANYAHSKIEYLWEQNKLPILVGGTGFYIKSIIFPDETISVPPNVSIRAHYQTLENTLTKQEYITQLQLDLQQKNSAFFERMNNSDKNNPRRLVRAIEVSQSKVDTSSPTQSPVANPEEVIAIGLTATREYLEQQILARVTQMVQNGWEQEIHNLNKLYNWDTPGMQTIGYREWQSYLQAPPQINKEELIKRIVTSHLQYARKQMIYLKRLPWIQWYSIEEQQWQNRLIEYCKSRLNPYTI